MAETNTMVELQELAEFVAALTFADLPDEVVEHAKWVVRDSIGVLIAGMREPEVAALAAYAARSAPGPCTLFGHPGTTTPEWAAMVHGTAGTSLEMDEGHAFARGHASIHAVPPALALAQPHKLPGKDALTAVVAGYEVAARAGVATHLRKGVHPFGAWGVLGAAAVGAKIAGLDGKGVAEVLELAASYAITPSFETAYQGANVRNTYAGIVNFLGLSAATFYGLGFRGEVGGLQTAFGEILGDRFNPEALIEDLGERYEIMRGYFKPYSACRYAHGTIDALLGLTREHPVMPQQIRSIQVATYDIAAGLREPEPTTPLAGRFSIPYVVATTLSLGTAGPEAYSLKHLGDEAIRALAARVEVVEDPAFTKLTPGKRPARVTLTLTDGTELQHTVMGSKGDPDQPMSEQELTDKFFSLVQPSLREEQARQAWQMLADLEHLPDLELIEATLRPQRRDV